jgi:hypothetical protein
MSNLQRWLLSQQNISDQYETEIHPEDINCMGVSSDIAEESFKSLCVQCKKNHLKKMISQLYTDIIKQVYKLALRILVSGQSSKVADRGYINIRRGSLLKVLFMTKYLKDKPSIENIQSFVSSKAKVLFERLAEVFSQYKISEKNLQALLMTDTYVLISRISKVIQPLAFGSQLCLKKMHQELFYTHLMKERSDIYKHLTFDLNHDSFAKKLLKKFRKFKNFEFFEEFDDFSVHTHCCSQCDSEFLFEEFQISFQDADKHDLACFEKKFGSFEVLTNDQIVEFIEGKVEGQEKKNKRRKRKNKDLMKDFSELDMEIDEFRKRLDCSPALVRSKPCFSKDFIEGLKTKLNIIKRE